MTKQISQLGKEKALLQEKVNTLELRLSDSEQRLNSDNSNFSTQIAQLKENFNAEKKLLVTVNDKYKAQYLDLEQQLSDVSSNYEKDKALWKGKFHFLEQQREQAKIDLADAQKKFELTLQQLQKIKQNDKQESDNAQNALMSSMERRYQNQIQELTEVHRQKVLELEERNKKLETDLKGANDKLLVDMTGKMGGQAFLEKKMTEMAETEKRLRSELETVKADRDSKALEYQKVFDKEREVFKGKLNDIEQKFRESESKRSTLVLEHEKQKAKWNLEKDHLANQKNDLQDVITKLEKQKENLLRENENIKTKTKGVRQSGSLTGGGFLSSNFLVQKSLNSAPKMKPASPADSRGSTPSIDKNGSDTTHGSRQFEKNGLGPLSFKPGSTVITSDDEA